jgi:hypothetical protein
LEIRNLLEKTKAENLEIIRKAESEGKKKYKEEV